MKNIEIKTSQNVVLEYELATLRERASAYLIDMLCIFGAIVLLLVLGFSIFRFTGVAATLFLWILMSIFIFYTLVMEVANQGQSLGKMAMRIRVIKTSGGIATFADYTSRWVFRMIDIYFSLTGLGSILIISSIKAQRIGDIVAGTVVIKLVPTRSITLNDLLSIHAQNSYIPKYIQVKQLAEEDVLLIKTSLERYQHFKNESHLEALDLLSERLRFVLAINDTPGDARIFLQTVLKDYVMLTR